MGITGEIVKSIFSRNRSFGTHESVRNSCTEKKRWSSVRSYLCGEELDSLLAEEDSASIKSLVQQAPLEEELTKGRNSKSDEENDSTITNTSEEHHPIASLFRKEDAAIIIQSAFRNFLGRRRRNEEMIKLEGKQESIRWIESPGRESLGTSIEVQTSNSVKAFSIGDQSKDTSQRLQPKPRTQLKIKEDWDDSTVSSNISSKRIQHRMEAMTRRERALAYAFSQQLRICAKKKQSGSNEAESGIGWSWLERWMATRVPDIVSNENSATDLHERIESDQRYMIRKRFFDIGTEEESCGSNEVPVQVDKISTTAAEEKDKSRFKTARKITKYKTIASQKDSAKAGKKGLHKEMEKAKKSKSMQGEEKDKDVSSNSFKI